jgi:acyl dehydratase
MTAPSYDALDEGTELAPQTFQLTRADLVRYAGASGDFNNIHWSDRAARAVGLPDVIAHGMLTMALAGRYVGEWCGDPGALLDFRVRFSRPVVVPDDEAAAELVVSGTVAEKIGPDRVVIELVATTAAGNVLTGARAEVRLSPSTV